MVIGLGTAAIFAASTAPALPAPTPPSPALHVVTAAGSRTAHPGEQVHVRIQIWATGGTADQALLSLSADHDATLTSGSERCTLDSHHACALGRVTRAKVLVTVTVTVPGSFTSGKIVFSAAATADTFRRGGDGSTITVAAAPTPSPTPGPTSPSSNPSGSPTPSPSPYPSGSTTPSATISASPSTSSSAAVIGGRPPNGSISATISASATASAAAVSKPGALSYLPPSPAGALTPAPNPSVALPPLAPAPSIAPPTTMNGLAGHTTALRDGSPGGQDLTFERIASTQAAWLAALLVAFSVLLTQVRLGRPAVLAQHKGVHRRRRRGPFQA